MRRTFEELDSSSEERRRLHTPKVSPIPLEEDPINPMSVDNNDDIDNSPKHPPHLASLRYGGNNDFLPISPPFASPSSSSPPASASSSSAESLSVPSSKMSIDDPTGGIMPGVVEYNVDSNLFPPSLFPVLTESTFCWNIECWDQLPNRVVSHKFQVGNFSWSLMMIMESQLLGLYLILHTLERSVCIDLIFEATSPDGQQFHRRGTSHRFALHDFTSTNEPPDWGFKNFISLPLFLDKLAQNNAVQLNVHMRILKDAQSFSYALHMVHWNSSSVDTTLPLSPSDQSDVSIDERAKLGYLGLHNQGATCYMNSILQSLFLTNTFRKSLLQIPTRGHNPHDSIALALQRIFWQLQFGKEPPNTNELTDSFGWDTMQAFTQHDVQEFLRALLDDLEEKMKNTPAEGSIERLFVAKVGQIVQCLNVPYESVREDTLYDIQLPIYGCKDLMESLDRFIAPEFLDGANKYNAEGHGLQDAKMFSMFTKLPPILHLILMRYRYDPIRDLTVKINDRFEFPAKLDMRPYVKDPKDGEDYTYELHSVLVHSGDLHGGHYCAFIREFQKDNEWFKFDDTLVSKVSSHEAIDENFGEDVLPSSQPISDSLTNNNSIDLTLDMGPSTRTTRRTRRTFKRITNAYMLVYVRKSELDKVLTDVRERDYDPNIGPSIQAELNAEKQRLERDRESKLTVQINWLAWKDVVSHHGSDLVANPEQGTGLVPLRQPIRVRHNDSRVRAFKAQLAAHLDGQMNFADNDLIVMPCALRKNQVIRPVGIMHPEEQYFHKFLEPPPAFFLAVPKSSFAVIEEPISKHGVLLLWKLFDGTNLNSLSFTMTSDKNKLGDLIPLVLKHSGLLTDDTNHWKNVYAFEEFTGRKIVPKELDHALVQCKLGSGDIIVLCAPEDKEKMDQYYSQRYNEVIISLRPFEGEDSDNNDSTTVALSLVINRNDTIQEVYEKASRILCRSLSSFRLITALPDDFQQPQVNFPLIPDGNVRFLDPRNADRFHFYTLYYQYRDISTDSSIVIVEVDQVNRKQTVKHEDIAGKPISDLAKSMGLSAKDSELWVLNNKDLVQEILSADDFVPLNPGRFVLAASHHYPNDVTIANEDFILYYKLNGIFGYLWISPHTIGEHLFKQLECERILIYSKTGDFMSPLTKDIDVHELLKQTSEARSLIFFECFSLSNPSHNNKNSDPFKMKSSPSSSICYSPSIKLKK